MKAKKTKSHLNLMRTAAPLAILAGASMASAQTFNTIYSQTFNGSSSTALSGSSPTVNNSGSAASWTLNNASADSSWYANGSVALSPSGISESLQLPFTPVAGNVYKLQTSFVCTGVQTGTGFGSWMGVGFGSSLTSAASGSGDYAFGNGLSGVAWMFEGPPSDGGNYAIFGGSGTANKVPWNNGLLAGAYQGNNYAGGGAVLTYDVTLDTTGPQWVADYYLGGAQGTALGLVGSTTFTTAPTIGAVGLTKMAPVSGTIDSFSLSVEATPEPSTLALAGLGGTILLSLAGRRRKS